ncbi:MAG: thiamine biosynthesis protein ThiS [Paenibacillaceae bacterium]|jgi:sulfur carrier protein|nr:thiamine biosynthesis protein ThiS [Paenibacillaceae bacterium]
MRITANGNGVTLEKELTVRELLTKLKVETPEYVTVQLNDDILLTGDFETRLVKDNDVVEFLYFMGGGAA